MACKDGQFDVVELVFNFQFKDFSINFVKNSTRENRGLRKLKNSKMPQNDNKSNFRNLKLKSHEKYLIYRTYFVK